MGTSTTTTPRKAAIYVRQSKDKTGKAAGVARQQEACEQLARQQGWEVAQVFVDNDVSATKSRPRPAYRQLLAALQTGAVDGVVCWHPDRLYRKATDLVELVDVVAQAPIVTVNAGHVDLTTASGRLVARLLGATAEYEGEHKAERWEASIKQMTNEGRPLTGGSRLFGYDRQGVHVPQEAAMIRQAAADLLAGHSVSDVTAAWNAAGVPTTRGKAWCRQSVKKLLQNPRLAGYITLRGQIVREAAPGEEWAPILDADVRAQVCELLDGNRSAWRATVGTRSRWAIASGLAYCGTCGARLETMTRSGSDRRPTKSYRCPPRKTGRGQGCTIIGAAVLEGVARGYAQTRLSDPAVGAALADLAAGSGARAQAARRELRELQARRQELVDALQRPGAAVATLAEAAAGVEAQIEQAERQLATASTGPALPPEVFTAAETWPEDVMTQRRLIALVVERVTVNKGDGPAKGAERVHVKPRVEVDVAA